VTGYVAGMAIGWFRAVVVDAIDPEGLAAFWAAVLGTEIAVVEEGWVQLAPDKGGAFLAFQPATAGRPTGMALRPDIEVPDPTAAKEQVLALGGTHVRQVVEPKGDFHEMMADPEGNEFCLVQPLPPELARHWPGVDD